MTLRVLHLHSGNLYGGVETLMLTLARADDAQVRHEFALCFEGRLSRELAAAGARVHILCEVKLRQPWRVLRARRLARRVLAQDFDLVVTHSTWGHALFAGLARRAGVPSLFWTHGGIGSKAALMNRIARRSKPRSVIFNSEFTRQQCADFWPDASQAVIYCPVAAPAPRLARSRQEIRDSLGVKPGAIVLACVARLDRYKGQDLLIRAALNLPLIQGVEVWLVGGAQRAEEREYLDELQVLATNPSGAVIRFLGERSDVAELLGAADIFCQPNRTAEWFGISFIEAIYAGLPVVTSALGGALEIVTPACGRLTPAGDVSALSQALCELISNPELREQLGNAGPKRARELCEPRRQIKAIHHFMAETARVGA